MLYPKHISVDLLKNQLIDKISPVYSQITSTYVYNSQNLFTPMQSTFLKSKLVTPFFRWRTKKSFIITSRPKTTNFHLLVKLCGLNQSHFSNSTNVNTKLNSSSVNTLNKSLLTLTQQVNEKLENKPKTLTSQLDTSLFNICFLRKEEMYTKLKYSRCPQYDMVSGGLAALFAGFLGFLICEKFGLELLDSGDFYMAGMYGVFLTFSVRPLLRSMSKSISASSVVSLKHLFNYLFVGFNLIVKYFK